jgi:integrase
MLQDGTENALQLSDSSDVDTKQFSSVNATGDLLKILNQNPPLYYSRLRSICGILGKYLELPGDQIPFDLIEARKRSFRPFLEGRRYTEASVRTYVALQRRLLNTAREHGWNPDGHPNAAWAPLFEIARKEHATDIIRHFARTMKSPAAVTMDDVEQWGKDRLSDGLMYTSIAVKKNVFWRILKQTGWIKTTPSHLMKFDLYGVPLEEMPVKLRDDIQTVLKWKQAAFAPNRPKHGRIRAITANNVRLAFQQLNGYVVKIGGGSPQSLNELIQPDNISGFIEWSMNERNIKGRSIEGRLAGILAIVKHHTMFKGNDYSWFKALIDSIPLEDPSEIKKRKAAKYVTYDELERIPDQIRDYREAYERQSRKIPSRVAQLGLAEFMFRWYLVFPWRQRNLRECRVGGPAPNLFKGKIPQISEIDKPDWVVEEEAINPDAEFWMISFAPDGTKTHIPVDLLLPRQLVAPLEQYLAIYRSALLDGKSSEMLFITPRGKPMRSDQIGKVIGHWTTKFASNRTTPHIIRDSVAYKWLKAHPKDYLTLSKILWHKNVQTTIQIYGARFNESSGTCAMEAWLDERAANK